MSAHSGIESTVTWFLGHSVQAGALVVVVLVVQWLFRRQLTPRWRFALWWVVLARLVLPVNPPSAFSLFNLVPPATRLSAAPAVSPTVRSAALPARRLPFEGDSGGLVPTGQPGPVPEAGNRHPAPRPAASPTAVPAALPFILSEWLPAGLAVIWFAGVLLFTGLLAIQLARFSRRLQDARPPAVPRLQDLLDECRGECRVGRSVLILETAAVHSPALYGLRRLRLLVPPGFGASFSAAELRYVFLHELAHVRRGDLGLNWLLAALQILHWFNPLLWLGFTRLRADRELACDERVLLHAGDQRGTRYGETVLKLLEEVNQPAPMPLLVGILEEASQMRRRIATIAAFRRRGRWSALAVLLVAIVAAAALTDAQTAKPPALPDPAQAGIPQTAAVAAPLPPAAPPASPPDLTGKVTAKGGGPPATKATVFIATAAPKTGTSTFCPSCYADCAKQAQADPQGQFRIESLDPGLTFQVLAAARGYRPNSITRIDPAAGPVEIELSPISDDAAAPDRSLRGRVVDAKGHPVAGAAVEMVGIESKTGGGSYGALAGIDPLAVTDDSGEFLITSKQPFELMDVKVAARGLADRSFTRLPVGKTNELVMTEGATITGRVLAAGKPLAGVMVGISGRDRSAGSYVGHFEIGTDDQGKFTLYNVPPDVDYWIYTCMDSMKRWGATTIEKIHAGKDGETTSVKDMVVAPAHRLAGQVVIADGQPIPRQVRLLVSREEAWDSVQIILDSEGRFDTTGIPSEMLGLSVRVRGCRISARNRSLDTLNPFQLIGRVDHDITNLVFLLEPGTESRPEYGSVDPEYTENRERPLRGAEGGEDHSEEWSLSGSVIDSETREPLARFHATPGQVEQFRGVAWSPSRSAEGTNGSYHLYLSKRWTRAQVKVEADGYLPLEHELAAGKAAHLDFVLKRGQGPSGRVVLPNGQPAVGATVVLLTGDPNGAAVNAGGELTTYGHGSAKATTDQQGRFSLKPALGMTTVAIGSSNGLVVASLAALATNAPITLPPFGAISGTLKRPSGPGTNETLDVAFAGGETGGLNLWLPAETDAQGHFRFARVPAGHLLISYRVPVGNNGWRNEPLQQVEVPPGKTIEVNVNAGKLATAGEMMPFSR